MIRWLSLCTFAVLAVLPPSPLWTSVRLAAVPSDTAVQAGAPVVPAVTVEPLAPVVLDAPEGEFASERSGLDLRFGDQRVPYRQMGVFALPGETVPVELTTTDAGVTLEASAGTITPVGAGRWTWTAGAEPGVAALRVLGSDGLPMATLNAFVMVPYEEMKSGHLRGYKIGSYPAPRRGREATDGRPRGFVAINDETRALAVSPHFQLGQFACKSPGPVKFAVVQPRLLLRLEGLLEAANAKGLKARTFQLMSAYRTPLYNRAIGNTTTFTRHQYGDAADIFVDDLPRDGRMDDLNRDGRFDRRDAMVLHQLAEATETATEQGGVVGGLSAYSPNHAHGAFVHVDTRGYAARW